jgi:trehalose-6-phosphate synthase
MLLRFVLLLLTLTAHCYRMLPVRTELLQGILGADLVSFNHFDYVRHFLNSCTRILGLESYPSRIEYAGRLISVS